jgi:hypothetical protein
MLRPSRPASAIAAPNHVVEDLRNFMQLRRVPRHEAGPREVRDVNERHAFSELTFAASLAFMRSRTCSFRRQKRMVAMGVGLMLSPAARNLPHSAVRSILDGAEDL